MNELPPPPNPLELPPADGGASQQPQSPQQSSSRGQQRWDDQLAEIWRTRPRRFPKHGYVAGVAAGFAWRYAIDPLVVRIALVLSAVLGGVGTTLYIGAWLLLPRGDDEASALGALFSNRKSSVPKWETVLLSVVFVVSFGSIGWRDVYPGVLWLAGWFLAVWFLHRRTPIPPADVPSAASAPGDPVLAQFATQPPAVSSRRRRGIWTAVAIVLLLPVIAGLAFFGWAFSADKPDGKIGERSIAVRAEAELKDSYGLSVGEVSLDLSELELTRDRAVRVENRVGEITVWVPEQANVRAVCHVRVGETACGGLDAQSPGKPTLTLDLSTQVGEVRVHRGAPHSGWDSQDGGERHHRGR